MRRISSRMFLGLAMAGILSSPNIFSEEINVACGVAPYENVFSKIKDGFEKETGIKINFVGVLEKNGADTTGAALLDGQAEIASAAVTFDAWQKILEEKKGKIDWSLFTTRVIGKDVIKVFAHPDNHVTKLSLQDLEKIFSGEAKNWNEFKGADLPIVIALQSTYPATNGFFRKKAMNNKELSKTAMTVDSVSKMIDEVLKTKGAIGFVSNQQKTVGAVDIETNEIIGRPVTAITKGRPDGKVKKIFEYISKNLK